MDYIDLVWAISVCFNNINDIFKIILFFFLDKIEVYSKRFIIYVYYEEFKTTNFNQISEKSVSNSKYITHAISSFITKCNI